MKHKKQAKIISKAEKTSPSLLRKLKAALKDVREGRVTEVKNIGNSLKNLYERDRQS